MSEVKKERTPAQLANDQRLRDKAKAKREATNEAATETVANTRARPERKPFGDPEQKLSVPEHKGFVRRWVRDDPQRLARFLEAGYIHVVNGDVPSSKQVKGSESTKVWTHGGVNDDGSPLRLFLLEQTREWYDEDQKLKQKPVDETDRAIREGSLGSGGLKDHEKYSPDGGIKVT